MIPMASLVYHAGALGDFITALPAIAVWRRLHPGEHSVLLGRRAHAVIALPEFDEVWNVDDARWVGLFAGAGDVNPGPGALPVPLSSALLFAVSSSPLAGALASLGVEEILRQDPFPGSPQPIVDYHLSLFPESVLRPYDAFPRVRAAADDRGTAETGVAALHPGSGGAAKNWPMDRYEELALRLAGSGLRVVWIRGPAESRIALPGSALTWDSLPLGGLAARLARAAIYVGNDSGVTHLAAAAGCPTVALFGASDARVWSPRGRAVRVVVSPGEGMRGISVESCCDACRMFVTLA